MLKLEDVKQILREMDYSLGEDNEVSMYGNTYYLEEHENEGWSSDGKYESNYYVYKLMCSATNDETGYHIGQGVFRSGSYFSSYDYEYEDLEIVKKVVEVVEVEKWVSIN